MNTNVFSKANILIPKNTPFEYWSVIACDQFSSEPGYWHRVRDFVGNNPSALNMIIPEAYLTDTDIDSEIRKITAAMDDYQKRGIFTEYADSLVLVERTLTDGRVRRGLIGTIDLEEYDFSGGKAAILASEGTVLDRLPPRVQVRKAASLELPHIMAFISDPCNTVFDPLSHKTDHLPHLYDFSLMENGGHIKGYRVSGADADNAILAMHKLRSENGTLMIMGDGNHSLAAAKVYWNEIKHTLDDTRRLDHPARFALIEVNNVYDPAISFEAIHRTLFGVKYPQELISALRDSLPSGNDYTLRWFSDSDTGVINAAAPCLGDLLSDFQAALDRFSLNHGCSIDYIHGDNAAIELSKQPGCVSIILPAMDKSDFFDTVTTRGVFPRKSFSVGHACDKRYYLECRKLL